MKCKNIQKELISYYYQDLNDALKAEIERHLGTCDKCMSSWERLKTTLNNIETKEPDFPHAFWQEYRRKVYEKIEGKKASNLSRFPGFAPALAAIVIVLSLSIFGGIRFYESKQERDFIAKNYELMKNLELFEDLEILEHMEEIEAHEKT